MDRFSKIEEDARRMEELLVMLRKMLERMREIMGEVPLETKNMKKDSYGLSATFGGAFLLLVIIIIFFSAGSVRR
ncbi:MAG: hypothetical protein HPY66_2347 [Firmicutes bacterium]|nr:hypothetical protein [Bacillota bacterium]MDI6705735.1 hypothetical protein [Bacillota bacterium]